MALEKIISGGQTGADQLGLEVAKELGFETGGWAPKGYRTEDGSDPSLRDLYGLQEHQDHDYLPRTKQNVLEADMTVVFGDVESPGSRQTLSFCKTYSKPFLCNPNGAVLEANIKLLNCQVLNIAGNRGSKFSEARRRLMREVLHQALAGFRPV